jgi:hypothetical protein
MTYMYPPPDMLLGVAHVAAVEAGAAGYGMSVCRGVCVCVCVCVHTHTDIGKGTHSERDMTSS